MWSILCPSALISSPKPGDEPLADRCGGLRRDVTRAQTRPARGEDQIGRHIHRTRRTSSRMIASRSSATMHSVANLKRARRQGFPNRRPAEVPAPALGATVAHRQYGDSNHREPRSSSPAWIRPPTTTRAKIPSRGIMQSPTFATNRALPVALLSYLRHFECDVAGDPQPAADSQPRDRSRPSTVMFSAKSPGETAQSVARNRSIASIAKRLTCRGPPPAWASPTRPKSARSSASGTFDSACPCSGRSRSL